MTAQHTRGPWTYIRNPENTRFIIDSEPHHAIATTAGYGCDDEDVARLISAAPDMLAALQALVGSFEKHRPKEFWDAARAAIAKATGQ